jgi:nucleoside-diphosphate kinase
MAIERTFSIIKPDATARNLTGAINALIEKAGLRIVAQKRIRMTREQAETFYAVHKAHPFFGDLIDFMSSGPVVVQVLEGENAILKHRDIIGATDRPRRRTAPFASSMRSRSVKTQSMDRTLPRQPRLRLPSSSPATRSSANGGD